MATHRMSHTRPYRIREAMRSRCYRSKHKHYKNYWGRGIIVCDRWLYSFQNFWEDMKEWYADNLQIDRIDNNWNYEPWNCKWSTPFENSKNKRTTVYKVKEKVVKIKKQRIWVENIKNKGENNWMSKFSDEFILMIRRKLSEWYKARDLHYQYWISEWHLSSIKHNKRHRQHSLI